jgi:hypothetical protein
MKNKITVALLVVCLGILGPSLAAQAEIYSFKFYAYTQRDTSGTDRLCMEAHVECGKFRAPDAIRSLTVTAPDGTVFDMANNCWIDLSKEFWIFRAATDFDSGTLPAGSYKAKVVDKSGRTFTCTLNQPMKFLDLAVITYPTNGQTIDISAGPPVFKWTAVSGAQHYRLLLKDNTWGEPVYWKTPVNVHNSYKNSYRVPLGDLMAGHSYSLQIEARDTDKGLNKRSRSAWVNFTVASP